jgi:hypothetical protein
MNEHMAHRLIPLPTDKPWSSDRVVALLWRDRETVPNSADLAVA